MHLTRWCGVNQEAQPGPGSSNETGEGTTRLITRVRSHYKWPSPSIAFSLLLEFGDIWMMRKMLLNPRERATTSHIQRDE
jgi:hypothetical protein